MENTSVEREPLVVSNDKPIPPAPGAEDQKPETPPAVGEEKPAEQQAETTEQQEERKQSKFQRRLDRQKTARVAAETEARLLREERDALRAKLEGKSQQHQDAEPKREDFPDYETYLRAVAKYDAKQVAEQGRKTDREERQREDRSREERAGNERVAQDWGKREKEFQAKTADYEAVVTPFVEEEIGSLSDGARQTIVESEVGPQLLYHLATNPDVAERIAELSPARQIAELGKLESVVTAPPTKPAPKAPAPLSKEQPGRSAPPGYSENMSDEDYRKWRKAQGARWAQD